MRTEVVMVSELSGLCDCRENGEANRDVWVPVAEGGSVTNSSIICCPVIYRRVVRVRRCSDGSVQVIYVYPSGGRGIFFLRSPTDFLVVLVKGC